MRAKTRSAPASDNIARPVASAVMAAADKSPDGHAGRLAGLDAAEAVLDHQRARRLHSHLFCREEKEVGRRLAMPDHLRGVEPLAEMRPQACDVEGERDTVEVAGRGHAKRHGQVGRHAGNAGNRLKRSCERRQHLRLQARQKAVGHDLPEIAIMLLDRLGAAPEKELERLLLAERDAELGQHLGQASAAQQLAVDEHAVAIEDDQIGSWLAAVHPAIRSYTHAMSNSSPRDRAPRGRAG
ncbi:hypothetical protein AB7M15_001589 [Bradyrhizobium ottawaense]